MSKDQNLKKREEIDEFSIKKSKELSNGMLNQQARHIPYIDKTGQKLIQNTDGKSVQKPIKKSILKLFEKTALKPSENLSPNPRVKFNGVHNQKSVEKPIVNPSEKLFPKPTKNPNIQQCHLQIPTIKLFPSSTQESIQKPIRKPTESSGGISNAIPKLVQKTGEKSNIHKAKKAAKRAEKLLHKDIFKKIDYSAIELEIVFIINQFPNMMAEYQKLRDQLKPDELEKTIKTDPKTNLRALERWSESVINGKRISNYKASCPVMSECSNAIGYFYDYDLYAELSTNIGSSKLLQDLQGALMFQTTKSVRMLMRLRTLFLHLSPSIADQDQFCSEILLEAITEIDHILSFDLISTFESYNDKSEDNVQLIFKQGGQLEDTRRMMMDVDMDFIRTLANELDVYIHSIKCFVDYMKKNANFISNLRDIIEKRGSSNHQ